jgi:hypothetical protein
MIRFSEKCQLLTPTDLSGIIIFNHHDYSTTFIQVDLSQYPQILTVENQLNCEEFIILCLQNNDFSFIKSDMMSRNLLLETF